MTTGGDIIYGGASGTGTRLTNGSAGTVLTSAGGTSAPTWTAPAVAASSYYKVDNLSFSASVAANALTIALKDAAGADPSSSTSSIGFRSATLTSGLFVNRSVSAALSIVVSSGSTLGHANAITKNIWLYALDNAGSVELAVSSAKYDESYLYSTTAEGGAGAADSESVIYSTTARTNVAIRLLGRLVSTQTTAGTWAVVPTDVSAVYSHQGSIAALYTGAPPTGTLNGSSNTVTFGTTVYDTRTAYSGGAYTIPESGYYNVDAAVLISGTYALNNSNTISIFIEGVEKHTKVEKIGGAVTLRAAHISMNLYLIKNQALTIRCSSDATTPTYFASAIYNRLSIAKISD